MKPKQRLAVQRTTASDVLFVALPLVIDSAELTEIYLATDYFWNASIEETFGMTTLAAISCGTFAIVGENTPG